MGSYDERDAKTVTPGEVLRVEASSIGKLGKKRTMKSGEKATGKE